MSGSSRFVFTHQGEMISVTTRGEMTRALDSVPGVKRASHPLDFLLKNAGWGLLAHSGMNEACIYFYEEVVSKAAIQELIKALVDRLAIHDYFSVKLYLHGIKSSLHREMLVGEAIDYFRELFREAGAVAVNSTPIVQTPKPMDGNDKLASLCDSLFRSGSPTEDVFPIARDLGMDLGEITTYFADIDSGRFLFTHIGSNVQKRMSVSQTTIARDFLGRPLDRAMDTHSAVELNGALRKTIRRQRPYLHLCEMEIRGMPYRYERLMVPVPGDRREGTVDHVISVLTNVEARA